MIHEEFTHLKLKSNSTSPLENWNLAQPYQNLQPRYSNTI